MAAATMTSSQRCQLRSAIHDLRERGLYTAAKWAAEQLVGLPEETTELNQMHSEKATRSKKYFIRKDNVISSSPAVASPIPEDEDDDGDMFLLAKAFFDMREYRRAAHALRGTSGKKSLFLRCYATYLAGEKRKEEEIIELAGPLGRSDAVNPELVGLEQELSTQYKKGLLDAFGSYLYGVVLHERDRKAEARAVLCASVNAYPWNWSAWLELQALCTDSDIFPTLNLDEHWMRDFFIASVYLELQRNSESLAACYRSFRLMFATLIHLLN